MLFENVVSYRGYKLIQHEGRNWIRIFYHNARNNIYFDNDIAKAKDQIFFINESQRFSVLGYINESFYIDNRFNFLIFYPYDYPDNLFFLNQSSHPLYSYTASNITVNYTKPSKCEQFETVDEIKLKGLALSADDYTIIDGIPNSRNWDYSIGATRKYLDAETFPGPSCYISSRYNSVHAVELWIQFIDFVILENLPQINLFHVFQRNLCSYCLFYSSSFVHQVFLYSVFLSI